MDIDIMKSEGMEIELGSQARAFGDLHEIIRPTKFIDLEWLETGPDYPLPDEYRAHHAKEGLLNYFQDIDRIGAKAKLVKSAVQIFADELIKRGSAKKALASFRQLVGEDAVRELMREEKFKTILGTLIKREGIFGRVYYTPAFYEDCEPVRKVLVKSGNLKNISYVLEGKRCEGCVYNVHNGQSNVCALMGKFIASRPLYTKKMTEKYAKLALSSSTKEQIKEAVKATTNEREKIKKINMLEHESTKQEVKESAFDAMEVEGRPQVTNKLEVDEGALKGDARVREALEKMADNVGPTSDTFGLDDTRVEVEIPSIEMAKTAEDKHKSLDVEYEAVRKNKVSDRLVSKVSSYILKSLAGKKFQGKKIRSALEKASKVAGVDIDISDILPMVLQKVKGVRVSSKFVSCPETEGVEGVLLSLGLTIDEVNDVGAGTKMAIRNNAKLVRKGQCQSCVFNMQYVCGRLDLKFDSPKIDKDERQIDDLGIETNDAKVGHLNELVDDKFKKDSFQLDPETSHNFEGTDYGDVLND